MTNFFFRFLILIFFLFFPFSSVYAATITVSPGQSIQQAINSAASGDTINVQAGTYNGSLSLNKTVILQGQSGAKISGSVTISGSNAKLSGFEITSGSGVSVSGSNSSVVNNYIHNVSDHGVYVTGSHSLVQGNTINYAKTAGVRVNGQYNQILNNDISHISMGGDADGIRFFGAHHLIKGNRIHDIYISESSGNPHSDCFQTWENVQDVIFEGNWCELAGSPNDSNDMLKFVMMQRGTSSANYSKPMKDIIFRNNIFYSKSLNPWSAIQVGNEACTNQVLENVQIYQNTFYRASSANFAVLAHCASNLQIHDNIFYNMGRGSYSYVQSRSSTTKTVTGNIVYGYSGSLYSGDININPLLDLTTFAPLPNSPICTTHQGKGAIPCGTVASPSPSPSIPSGKPGDANNDNKVDGVDYVIWLNHYNQSVSGPTNGDFNNSGKVDGVDYVVWLNNYGK